MHLRTGVIVSVIAAAAGAAGARAFAPASGAASPSGPATFAVSSATRSAADSPGARPRGRTRGEAVAVVYVAGAVVRPGVYRLPATARVTDALHAAGGATAAADLIAVDLAERVEDGQEVAVPLQGAEAAGPAGRASASAHRARRSTARRGAHRKRRRQRKGAAAAGATAAEDAGAASTADGPLDAVAINLADEATLETLPGIGPSLAARLIAFRDLNGPFTSSDELLDVGGMTPAKLDALAPYISF